MRLTIPAFVALCLAGHASADPALVAGGLAGGASISREAYFPTYFAGGVLALDVPIVKNLSLEGRARVQAYFHPEDEDFGSHGVQNDVTLGLRLAVVQGRSVSPYLVVRGGLLAIHRVPYCRSCPRKKIVGMEAGLAAGLDIVRRSGLGIRLELAYDHPSVTAGDDVSGPAGELSGALLFVGPLR